VLIKHYIKEGYGKNHYYGTYATPACYPMLNICNLDLVKDVVSKDNDHFLARTGAMGSFVFGNGPTKQDRSWKHLLATTKEDEWKDMR